MELTSENLRAYVYLETKRGIPPTTIFQQLEETKISPLPSLRTVQEWSASFKNNTRISFADAPRTGRPPCATTNENIALIKNSIDEMPRQSLRSLSDDTGLSKDSIHRILTKELGLRKVCSTWVPHHLTETNKQDRILCAQSLIQRFDSHSMDDCMKLWVTEDETWILFSTPGAKEDNKAWLTPGSQRLQVIRSSLTNKKVMLMVAFTGDGKLSLEGKPPGETITGEVYVDFLRTTGEKWRCLRSSPTRLSQVWWQHDNARPHVALCVKNFTERRGMTVIRQSPYSPDMNQCDRWVNKELKKHFRHMTFQSAEDVCDESLHFLRSISRERFIQELRSLIKHCHNVIQCNGGYTN
jgi:hypothetical protein